MMKYQRVLTVQSLSEILRKPKSIMKSNFLFLREQLLFWEWLLPQVPKKGVRYETLLRRYCEATGDVPACRVPGDTYIPASSFGDEGYFCTRRQVEDAILACKAELYVSFMAATEK